MIPLKLTLKGIYSYIEEQVIDFEQLTGSGIFGIFGSVGSGKSTILEAITFAIYNDTERLNSRDSRNYNMMNLKSNNLLIDFEFYTTTKDIKYRFIVKTKRNKNKFEDVTVKERRTLISENNGEWMPTEKTPEEIIGLSYKNFKRTIIIPQGKFKEFLELGAKDRTDMLNEIFHLQRFDLAPRLGSIKKENEEQLSFLSGEMEQYKNLSKEGLDVLVEERKEKTKIESSEHKLVEVLRAEIDTQNKLKNLYEKLNIADLELQNQNKLKDNFDKRKTKLENYSYCRINFSEPLNSEFRLEKKNSTTSTNLKSVSEIVQSLEKNKSGLTTKFEDLKKDFDNKEIFKKEAEELNLIVATRKLIEQEKNLTERVEKGRKVVDKHKAKSTKLRETIRLKKSEILELKESSSNISELHNVRSFYEKRDNLNGELFSLKNEITGFDKEKKSVSEQAKKIVANKYSAQTIAKSKEKISEEIKVLKEKKTNLNKEINHLLAREKLKEWADNLEEGKSCSVCGSTHHPNILDIADLHTEITNISKKEEALTETTTTLEGVVGELNVLETKLEGFAKLLDTTKSKLKNKEGEIDAHSQNFVWEKYKESTLEKISQIISETEKLSKKILDSEKEINTDESEFSGLQIKIEDYSKAITEFSNEQVSKNTAVEINKKYLETYTVEQFVGENNETLLAEATSKNKFIDKVAADYKKLNDDIIKVDNSIAKNQGEIKQLEDSLKNDKSELKTIVENIELLLKKSAYNSLEKIKSILLNTLNEQTELQAINDFYNNLKVVSKEVEELKVESKNKVLDIQKLEENIIKLKKKEEKLKSITLEIGALSSKIDERKSDLEKKKKLEKNSKDLLKRKDNILLLTNLFKAKGFVNYISTVYLQNLSESANDRFFRMTKQHLQLEINESNEFQVRDHLCEGETRSVKTLSGGQMFQASLSLALALADSVQNQVKANNNFFFLDEGFGSLDDESLRVVFETLKSLKDENRIVGIISHVESLKQEIDVHLQVDRYEDKGSLVNYSWR